jgi:hypothetical protein
MKRVVTVLTGALLLTTSACASIFPCAGVECRSDEQLTPELLIERAEANYAENLAASGSNRSAATEKTAEYLRGLSGVKTVSVRGSDTLLVIMTDGSDLLIMLGKNRL